MRAVTTGPESHEITVGKFGRAGFIAALAVIVLATAWARADGLNPRSLWYDDAWVALVKKIAWHNGVLNAGRSSPLGFTIVTKLALDLGSDLELAAQTVPFMAGLAAIPVFAVLVLQVFESRTLALLGAALTAVAPTVGMYATRVKQYSLEHLISITLLLLFWQLVVARERQLRRLMVLCGTAVVCGPFGHAPLFVAFVLVHVGTAWVCYAPRPSLRRIRAAGVCVLFDVLFGAYYLLVLRGQASEGLDHFWSAKQAFAPVGGSADAWLVFMRESVWDRFIAGAFPTMRQPALAICGLLFCLGPLALLIQRERRVLGAALLALYLQALVLSALRLYPLGGYRVDMYMHPVHLLMVTGGLWLLLVRAPLLLRSVVPAGLTLAVLGYLPGLAAASQEYHPGGGASRLIASIERDMGPDRGILIYPTAVPVFAIYTTLPVSVSGRVGRTGYDIRALDPNVMLLRGLEDDFEGKLQTFLAQRLRRRIYYLYFQQKNPMHEAIIRILRRRGYRVTADESDDHVYLMRFDAEQATRPRETP